MILSLNKEKATAFSKGVHCYQTCGANYTPDKFVCDMIEIGEASYTPQFYKVLSTIEEVESGEGSDPWVTFQFKTSIINYYTETLGKSTPYHWLYAQYEFGLPI